MGLGSGICLSSTRRIQRAVLAASAASADWAFRRLSCSASNRMSENAVVDAPAAAGVWGWRRVRPRCRAAAGRRWPRTSSMLRIRSMKSGCVAGRPAPPRHGRGSSSFDQAVRAVAHAHAGAQREQVVNAGAQRAEAARKPALFVQPRPGLGRKPPAGHQFAENVGRVTRPVTLDQTMDQDRNARSAAAAGPAGRQVGFLCAPL